MAPLCSMAGVIGIVFASSCSAFLAPGPAQRVSVEHDQLFENVRCCFCVFAAFLVTHPGAGAHVVFTVRYTAAVSQFTTKPSRWIYIARLS